MVSQNKEDYLRAFYILEEREKVINVTNISSYLKISKPSVSQMIKILSKDKFLNYIKYGELKLTKKGKDFSRKLTIKHRIIETFLRDILKLNLKEIHNEADKLEHAMSDETVFKLKKLLRNPGCDPHGKKIPS